MRTLSIASAAAALLVSVLVSSTAAAQSAAPQQQPAQTAPAGTMQQPYIVQLHPQTGGMPTPVAMSGPRVITDWSPGEPVPQGYHPEQRTRTGLIIGGAVPFGIFYMISAMTAAIGADANVDNQALYVPAIGPFIQMVKSDTSTERFFCALDGVVQSGGLAMLIYGIASPRDVLVRNDLGFKVTPRPFATRGGAGLALGGTF